MNPSISDDSHPQPRNGDILMFDGYRVVMEWAAKGDTPPSVELRRQNFCHECEVWYDFDFSPHPNHEAP